MMMVKASNKDINIIVVDDEEVVVSLVRDALQDDGFSVETAQDAFEALDIIEHKAIDLVITDIRMPKMDGIEMIKRVREMRPDVTVIFTTGYANLNSAKDALQQGATDYILKPFELKEMRQAVNVAVEKIRKESEARESDAQLDRLSDLHRMLFTVGDRKTLITISLRFAMMHCESKCGSVVYWNSSKADVGMLSIDNDNVREREFPEHVWLQSLDQLDSRFSEEPVVIEKASDHPLLAMGADGGSEGLLFPFLEEPGGSAVLMPVSRGSSVFGFITVSLDGTGAALDDTDLKFLTFTAHQLAMSLENLEFLEEAQNAYTRLKELQDETIQLEKMATRGEMSAEVGHELNNFLGVVAGNLSLLDYQLKNKNYDEMEKYVAVMVDNLEKIKKFTSNLMDLRAISTKKEVIYFDRLLTEVIDYLKPQRRFRGVKITLEPIEASLPFQADTVHIQQVLYNLFNNAADAMVDRERREITVSTGVDSGGDTFHVTIADTGTGIEPENLKKVFHEKFTTKEKGHGFGLVVCQRIIRSHGGNITIESTPGEGTSFTIKFPLHQESHEIPAPDKRSEPTDQSVPSI